MSCLPGNATKSTPPLSFGKMAHQCLLLRPLVHVFLQYTAYYSPSILSFFMLFDAIKISMSSMSTQGPVVPDINRGSIILIVSWLTVSLALLLVSLRFYIRGVLRKNLGWDDHLVLVATVSYDPSGLPE